MKVKYLFISLFLLLGAVLLVDGGESSEGTTTTPQYPTDIEVGNEVYLISSRNHKALYIYDKATNRLKTEVQFDLPVTGVKLSENTAYVTSSLDKGYISKVDIETGKITATKEAGMGAKAPILSSDKKTLYVCNQFKGTVQSFDAETLSPKKEVAVLREPFRMVLSADDKYIFVNNFLPMQAASLDYVAADVSVIDATSMTKIKDIKLDNGSNALRDITLSPDGKYVLVSHNLGRFQVPTSQLQQGWMNTSAMSVIDATTQEFLGSVLFDEPERGAAGIWGIAVDKDNLVISHSGTHDISIVKYNDFKKKFEERKDRSTLSYDLYFLYGIRERLPLTGNGPRNIRLSEGNVYIPTYFSDTLNIVSLADHSIKTAALNPNRVESSADMGEKFFNDATYCFQNWQSCNGCHPGDARTDGMNWDLMNDGIGNPKNCKSMLFAHSTNPNMISGIRPTADIAVRAGFKFIQFADISEEKAIMVDDYLKSLKPLPSPYLVNGELSETATYGRTVFERLKCDECHSGPMYTDLQMHRIGEDVEFEKGWDTPTLREIWRTAPYLFDGRAATIEEVFEVHKHGINGKVSKKDLAALAEYVKSL